MTRINRRNFIERTLAGLGSLTLAPPLKAQWSEMSLSATARVALGKTGIQVTPIAMGTGFNGGNRQSNQTRLGLNAFVRLMQHGYDHGLSFFDMADLYGSHTFMRKALTSIPRDEVVLLSKIWFADGAGMEATDRAVPSVDRFRRELGTEMIDICLIHCVIREDWPQQLGRMRDELSDLKQKGVVRAVGCSCHSLDALKTASEDPWVDVIFARINNQGASMDSSNVDAVAAVLQRARRNGKAVVGMKIYGAGKLTAPEQRDSSLRFVWGNQLVDAMTIGFEETSHIDGTIDHLNAVLRS